MKLHVERYGSHMNGFEYFVCGEFRPMKKHAQEDLRKLKASIKESAEIRKENETLRARLAELEKQEPVHWRALLSAAQQHMDLVPNIVGFTTFKAAGQFCAETKDFSGWDYTIEPLFAAPVVSPDVEKLKAELEGERAAALNYRNDAIEAGEKCDELLAALEAARKVLCKVDDFLNGPTAWTQEQENSLGIDVSAAIEQAKGGVK